MKNRIITISRQFGSGGRTVGREVAKKLGIPCYDQELIERLAEESGFAKEYIKNESEYRPFGSRLASALNVGTGFDPLTNQDRLWIAQKRMILELGAKENCVIVGRCADAILEDKQDCLKVFIHASFEQRAKRIVEVYGETEVPTAKRLRDKDKRRISYYQYYTDKTWGDINNYDVALDAGALGIDKCVEIIAGLY